MHALRFLALTGPFRLTPGSPRASFGMWREAFRSGYQGALSDIEIYTRPWGVELPVINAPVHVWHGTADRNVPVSVGRFVAEQLPHGRSTIVAGAGHVSNPAAAWARIPTQATA